MTAEDGYAFASSSDNATLRRELAAAEQERDDLRRELAEDPEWVVNDLGELGVKVRGRYFFLYKGHSLEYETGLHDDGTPMLVRPVGKREFGEVCHPVEWIVAGRRQDRYTKTLVHHPGLSSGAPGDSDWHPLPRRMRESEETSSAMSLEARCDYWRERAADLRAQLAEQARQLAEAREAIADYETLADLQQKREQPWIERWQQETGKRDSLPDYGDVLKWIVSEAERAERDRDEARAALEPFASGRDWGTWKAWLVEGAPTREQGIEAARWITGRQVAVDTVLAAPRPAEPRPAS